MIRTSKCIDVLREEVVGENFLRDILKLPLSYLKLRDINIKFILY